MRKIIITKRYKVAQRQQWKEQPGNTSATLDAKALDDIFPSKQPLDENIKFALRNLLQSRGMEWKPGTPEEASYQLEIIFSSSGYNDPGQMSGSIENAYPPEGDEERIVQEVILTAMNFNNPNIDGREIELPQPLATNVGEYFRDSIDTVELDEGPTGPEDLF